MQVKGLSVARLSLLFRKKNPKKVNADPRAIDVFWGKGKAVSQLISVRGNNTQTPPPSFMVPFQGLLRTRRSSLQGSKVPCSPQRLYTCRILQNVVTLTKKAPQCKVERSVPLAQFSSACLSWLRLGLGFLCLWLCLWATLSEANSEFKPQLIRAKGDCDGIMSNFGLGA